MRIQYKQTETIKVTKQPTNSRGQSHYSKTNICLAS
jgi:hypothetical protein